MQSRIILRQSDIATMDKSSVEVVIKDLEKHAPHTLALLHSCIAGRKKSQALNLKTKGQTRLNS